MIDNENLVYDTVSSALRDAFDSIFIVGTELTDKPPRFPAVSIVQKNSMANEKYSTFDKVENAAIEEYEFGVYSNLENQAEAKRQVKEITAVIDGVMSGLFYIRTFCRPVPNADK
jgi:hypothetical protein